MDRADISQSVALQGKIKQPDSIRASTKTIHQETKTMVLNPRWAATMRAAASACQAIALAGSLILSTANASAQAQHPPELTQSAQSAPIGTLSNLNVVGFEGAFNLPVWVGQQQGFFAANGLKVNLSFPSSSVEVIRQLTNGSAQLSLMSIDNVLAYRRAQGEKGAPDADDLVVFMGGDHGYLTLVARSGIDTVEQLRNHVVSVDAMTTGFAFVLLDALQAHHLDSRDINIVAVGGTGYRYRALMAGKQDATLLRIPFELLAEQQGFTVLLPASRLTPAYQGTIGAVRTPWAATHRADMLAFITAYHQALEWIFDKRNEKATIAILHTQYPDLSDRHLLAAYRALTNRRDGLIRDMTIDQTGLAQVERLRDKYAPLSHSGHASSSGVDLSCLQAARQSGNWNR
jgi:ABC-type nitrate/sulfonate/bicarbonate transport system substrate-binding protein